MSYPWWPDTLRPSRIEWHLRPNTARHISPFSGSVQTQERPGARHVATLHYDNWDRARSAAYRAFIASLRGSAGRFWLWPHDAETPLGSIGGAAPVQNLVRYSSFETDSNGDGTPDGWSMYNSAPATEPATVTNPVGGVDGGRYFSITWAVPNSLTKGCAAYGVSHPGDGAVWSWRPNATYLVSWYGKASGAALGSSMNTVANAEAGLAVVMLDNPPLTSSWQRYVSRVTRGPDIPSNNQTSDGAGRLWITIAGTGQTGTLDIDHVQIEEVDPSATDPGPYISTGNQEIALSAGQTAGAGMIANRQNRLSYSDDWSQWAMSGTTVSGQKLIEDASSGNHYMVRNEYIPAVGSYVTASIEARAAGRTQFFIQLSNVFGLSQNPWRVFDLSSGAPETGSADVTTGLMMYLGDGWYRCVMLTSVPVSVATTCGLQVYLRNVVSSYLGDGTSGVEFRNASLIASRRAGFHLDTNGAAVTDEPQTGNTLYTAGWTPSQSGLLLPGDFASINGELKLITAQVDSDAFGLAQLSFEPPLRNSPPDGTPIIVSKPPMLAMLEGDDEGRWSQRGKFGGFSVRVMEAF